VGQRLSLFWPPKPAHPQTHPKTHRRRPQHAAGKPKAHAVRKTPPKAAPSHRAHARRVLHRAEARRPRIRLIWPVRGKITSGFGRRHGRVHDGIDIAAPRGTKVRAAASGVVVYADHRLSGYGNMVIIRHPGEIFTAYAHNARNLVRKGDHVRQGQVIATVGASGRASGPHLHFEVRIGAQPVDPLAYLPPSGENGR
ncbi:MAG: M23 family metallopeptidase, partial [Zetaproteobacteria bacterium]